MDDDDFAKLLLDFTEEQLLEASEEEDIAELLLEPSEELLDITELLLESTEELDEDVIDEELSVFFSLEEDFAELLLDTLVSRSLDCGVTLKELLDFTFELLKSSQFLQTEDEETSSESVTEILTLSSSQATNNAATTPIIKNFCKAINYTQSYFFAPGRNISKSRCICAPFDM